MKDPMCTKLPKLYLTSRMSVMSLAAYLKLDTVETCVLFSVHKETYAQVK